MSRFVDPSSTFTVDLGPCDCPVQGKHERDTADIQRRLSGIDQLAVSSADDLRGQTLRLFNRAIRSWSLIDEKGEPVPLDVEHLALLDDRTVSVILDAWNSQAEDEPLPNGSGAPSQDSSPGSASPSPVVQPKIKRR